MMNEKTQLSENENILNSMKAAQNTEQEHAIHTPEHLMSVVAEQGQGMQLSAQEARLVLNYIEYQGYRLEALEHDVAVYNATSQEYEGSGILYAANLASTVNKTVQQEVQERVSKAEPYAEYELEMATQDGEVLDAAINRLKLAKENVVEIQQPAYLVALANEQGMQLSAQEARLVLDYIKHQNYVLVEPPDYRVRLYNTKVHGYQVFGDAILDAVRLATKSSLMISAELESAVKKENLSVAGLSQMEAERESVKCDWQALQDLSFRLQGFVVREGVLVQYQPQKNHDTALDIPDDITAIGEYAFASCSSLTSVTIPDSVTSIDSGAFKGCSSLTDVVIPDSVTKIGKWAFANCSSLTSVTIPNSVTEIGDSVFDGCSSLTDVVIPDSVTKIGVDAFKGCSSLTDVVMPDSVTKIGAYAFEDCSNLTSVTIPDSVTSIGDNAFYRCNSLTSVMIPNSATKIDFGTFKGCSSLTDVVIPDSVTKISVGAFEGCSSLTSVTIPNSVTAIGNRAFYGCSSLTSVMIPNSATKIDFGTFYGCSNLTDVIIPDSVTKISVGAFEGCSSLTSVTIPNSVTEIGNRAFYGCSSLTSVTMHDGVISIGNGAFAGTPWRENQQNSNKKTLAERLIAAKHSITGKNAVPNKAQQRNNQQR